MKLVRFGNAGKEKPGVIDDDGRLRDLSAVIKDIGPEQLGDAALNKLRKLKLDKLPLVKGKPRMGCPLTGIGKFVAIGLNYADHAAEAGMPIPVEPIVFMKATTCIQGPDDPVMLPKGSVKSDWEVELGIVIGTQARHVSQKTALDHVAGYCTVNDVSEREYQLERGGTWDKGKGFDTFGPIGPWLVDARRSPQPAEARHVARPQWQARAVRQHQDDDLRRRQAGELREPVHDAHARRRDHHRHAARRRHGHETACLPEKGRRDDAGHRRARRPAAGGGAVQALNLNTPRQPRGN